ncbi:EAL domain-containing protein [Novosphingobium sp. FKTRR1]|uniref:EAL domain-containing protein n=1 Tax=Novosphingobium sp. FKTRR1 TaxID=2879118 RepID=UPI001CEFF28F|nr:EAL domain-containing protein [Novosphingobium sp. FKTRR1]
MISLALWLFGAGGVINHAFWNAEYKFYGEPAPKSIVLVATDEIHDGGSFDYARLLQKLRQQGVARVFFDTKIPYGLSKSGDTRLREEIAAFGNRLVMVVRAQKLDSFEADVFRFPPPDIAARAPIAVSAWNADFLYYVKSGPYSVAIGNTRYPTVSAELAGVQGSDGATFEPDFAMDPATIPRISGLRLLDGAVPAETLRGKQVLVTNTAQTPSAGFFGHEIVGQYAADIAGAVALHKPLNLSLGIFPLLLLASASVWLAHRSTSRLHKSLLYGGAVWATLLVPVPLRTMGIVVEPEAAMLLLLFYSLIRMWQKRTRRIQHTSASGLPNLLAISTRQIEIGRDVIVAVIARYEEMLATLPQDLHGEYARQIARRISVGSGTDDIFHGDGGHFAWTEEARPLEMQLSHLEGMRALFSAPLQIGPHTFDTTIHFGLDRNEGLDALTRVNSALASANEALNNGRAIELFEAHRLAEAPWELSLHARIDEGLRNGDIWLAFQSQWDVPRGRICGAEALIRWNHPTRGPIAPDAFILHAERAGRIDALTYWVLEQAITAAHKLNALGQRFQMSVNLSAQMVDKADLVTNFAEIVRRRAIDPTLLTIEITETSSVRNRPAACHNLTQLRKMGFRLSIDDFGTGEASLAYLADLPSDELKLDRRFVSKVVTSERDRTIVTSTIHLAHALGQVVVAEGIEDAATFALLRDLGCDHAQGYYLGRPQPFAVFEREYQASILRQTGSV